MGKCLKRGWDEFGKERVILGWRQKEQSDTLGEEWGVGGGALYPAVLEDTFN